MAEVEEQKYLDYNPLPVWVCSSSGSVLQVNNAAVSLSGSVSCIGKQFTDLAPEVIFANETQFRSRFFTDVDSVKTFDFFLNRFTTGEEERWFVTASPSKEENVFPVTDSGELLFLRNNFALAASHSSNCVVLLDQEGRIRWVNKCFQETLEYTLEEIYGHEPFDVIHSKNEDPAIRKELKELLEKGEAFKREVVNYSRSGKECWFDIDVMPVNSGQWKGFLSVAVDITALKKAINDLNETQNLLQAIIQHAPLEVYMKDKEGRYVLYNDAFGRYLSEGEKKLTHDYHLFDGEDLSKVRRMDQTVLATGETVQFEQELNLDGKLQTFFTTKFPLHDVEKKVYAVGGLSLNITQRKQTELSLLESERRFRSIADSAPGFLWVVNAKREMTYISKGWFELIGKRAGRDRSNVIHPDDKEILEKGFAEAYDVRRLFTAEFRVQNKSGRYRWITAKGTPRYLEDGSFVGYIGSCFDITERKELEEELRKSRSLYKSVVQVQKELICRYTPEGIYTFVNDAFCKAFGFAREALLGTSVRHLPQGLYPVNPFAPDPHPHIEKFTGRDGRPSWFEWTDNQIYDTGSGEVTEIQSVGNDVTERITTELEVNRISTRLLLATHAGEMGIWELDIDTGKAYWDARMFEIFGCNPDMEPGLDNWRRCVHPEDLTAATTRLLRAAEGKEEYASEYRIIRQDGSVRYVMSRGRLQSGKGRSKALIGISWDFTERKLSESRLKASEKQFRELVQNLTVGVLVISLTGQVQVVNDAILKLVNLSEQDMVGKFIWDTPWKPLTEDGDVLPAEEDPCRISIVTGEKVRNKVIGMMNHTTGETVFLLVDAVPSFDESGNVSHVTVSFSDITRRLKAETQLQESQHRLALATSSAMIGIWEWDVATNRLTWDENMFILYGLPRNEATGLFEDFARCAHPEDLPLVEEVLRDCVQRNIDYSGEFRIIRPEDNSVHYISSHGTLSRDQNGGALRMVGVNFDITHQKSYANTLKELSDRLTLATTAANLGIWDFDLKTGDVIWDAANRAIYGITDSRPLTVYDWVDLLHPEDGAVQLRKLKESSTSEDVYDSEFRIIRDSEVRYIKTLGIVRWDKNRKPIRMVGINWDITEQKRNEEKILQNEARYKAILDDQLDVICRFNSRGLLTFVNKSYVNTFSSETEKPDEKSYVDLFDSTNRGEVLQLVEDLFQGKQFNEPLEFPMEVRGEHRWMQWMFIPLKNEYGEVYEVQSIGRDVTGRKQLEVQQARLNKIVRESYNEIYLFNAQTLNYEFANHASLKNLGYSLQELTSMKVTDLFFHPNEMALKVLLRSLRSGQTDRLQLQMRHRRKDGSAYDVEALIQVLEPDRTFVAIATDITEKLVTEKKLIATIQEKETLLKEIHHRVKNNLQLISSIIYIKLSSVKEPDTRHFFNEMRQKIHSIALIHERLLQAENLDQVEISDYLGRLIYDLEANLGAAVPIRIDKKLDKAFLDIDSAIYCALIVNELITNSIKHAFHERSSGTVRVSFAAEASGCTLCVSDDGSTLPEDVKPGSGSFGMHMLHVFVQQLRGRIEIIRENGTAFRISFNPKQTGQ